MAVITLLMSIIMPLIFIHDYESYDYSSGIEVATGGLKGLKNSQNEVKKIAGDLSISKLNEVLKYLKSFPEDQAYRQGEIKYPGLFNLFKDTYAPLGQETSFKIGDIENTDDFYDRILLKAKEKKEFLDGKQVSDEEMEFMTYKINRVETPFRYDFIDQWSILIKSMIFVYVVIALLAVVISCNLFSYENEKNMGIVLKTIGRKKLLTIGLKKIFSAVVYLTILFLVCTLIISAIVFGTSGISGWGSQIQIIPGFLTSLSHWTVGEMYINSIIISLLCITSIALIGSFINVVFQKLYPSLVVAMLIVVPPMLLYTNATLSAIIRKLLNIQPINGINLLSFITSLSGYDIGVCKVLVPTMVCILAGVTIVLGVYFTPRIFCRWTK